VKVLLPLAVLAAVVGLWLLVRGQRHHQDDSQELEVIDAKPAPSADTIRRRELPADVVNQEAARIGKLIADAVAEAGRGLEPGMTTKQVADHVFEHLPRDIEPAMLGFNGFPAAVSVSVNEQVLHGIPSAQKRLIQGDLVTIQFSGRSTTAFGAVGWTFPVGEMSAEAKRLHDAGFAALDDAIARVVPDVRTGDIGAAIQSRIESAGFAVVRDYVGYTMGAELIQPPQIPCYGQAAAGPRLRAGTVLNLHVIAKQGDFRVKVQDDGWTVTGAPGELSVLFTAMVLITGEGHEVLTPVLTSRLDTR
jgi:methionyl aminopeptidase